MRLEVLTNYLNCELFVALIKVLKEFENVVCDFSESPQGGPGNT